jgi:hypothetical protein
MDEAFGRASRRNRDALFAKLVANGSWFDPSARRVPERLRLLWSNQPEAMVPRRATHERLDGRR